MICRTHASACSLWSRCCNSYMKRRVYGYGVRLYVSNGAYIDLRTRLRTSLWDIFITFSEADRLPLCTNLQDVRQRECDGYELTALETSLSTLESLMVPIAYGGQTRRPICLSQPISPDLAYTLTDWRVSCPQ